MLILYEAKMKNNISTYLQIVFKWALQLINKFSCLLGSLRIINKLKFIYYFTAEIHFSALKLKKYYLQENVNSNGTGKKSGHAQRDFCEAKILRRKTQK